MNRQKYNKLQKNILKGLGLALVIMTVSCQKTQFVDVSQEAQASLAVPDFPVDAAPPLIVPKPQPVYSNGACAPDSSTRLTSCETCQVPLTPPALPQFSQKGQSLIDIMSIACSVPNKSAPKNYVAPTKSELISRLNQLSPVLYPDSAMSAFQVSTIEGLKTNPALQQKMFGGLWYQPPYSDAFETYFGLEVSEVVYQICYQSPASIFTPYNSSLLLSKQMIDCQRSDSSIFGCKELPNYIDGNIYRNQLRAGMRESISNPYVAAKPLPSKTCSWEKFDGLYELGGAEQIGKWLITNQKISMEVKGPGARCSSVSSLPSGSDIPQGEVILSAYVCQ
jgi:hypothetical protein